MQTTASFLADLLPGNDIVEPIEPKKEARLPDFLVFRIDTRREVLLLVEIKSEDGEDPQMALLSTFQQADIQAKFAFERWPSHAFIFALLIKGTKFSMHQFKRASLLPLPHHNLNKNARHADHMPYHEDNRDTVEPVGVTTMLPAMQRWTNVFVEKRVREEYLPPFEKFSKEFKRAMDEVMDTHKLGRLQWED
ncbi:hypothetical protein LshimejAT787_2001450 [Lyophyllum shimeji]|uniref:Uncharacterized protein n=1 Tax=Lyophyllum shimeji TaxID=47721 RepID=A0A9P3PY70_LYOSH|nr:hypothetical protein LshimejAT787_2001450 [Lyophyllum shimeji]